AVAGGSSVERPPERVKAPHRVLGGVGAVDAEHQDLGAPGRELVPPLADAVAGGEGIELRGVQGDGVRMRDTLGVRTATEQRAAAVDEGGAPLLGVEADAVA